MTPSPTGKFAAWFGLALALLYAALVFGRPELVVVAAPLLTGLLIGALAREPEVSAEFTIDPDRCLDGDTVACSLTLTSTTGARDLEIGLWLPAGLDLTDGSIGTIVTVPPDEPTVVPFTLRARRWGAYRIGLVGLRARGPGGFLTFDANLDLRTTLRAYPAPEAIVRPIRPPHSQAFAGNYVSRDAGEGIEFVDVRRYSGAEPIRRINWRVSARRSDLYVNLYAPERNSDVVLFLDVFDDVGAEGSSSLDLTIRGALGLARHHLNRRDRVGIIGFGGIVSWLSPSMGRTHEYRVADHLLDMRVAHSYAWKNIDVLPRRLLPPLAMVVAFSPLTDKRVVDAINDLNSRGFPVVVVDTLNEDAVVAGRGDEAALAYRVWKMRRAAAREALTTAGVPVLRWDGTASLQAVLAEMPRHPGYSARSRA
ncbi:MAG: DUF58 domain-containing protein [Actinomycetota bacterium]